jgi:hypothetical protein
VNENNKLALYNLTKRAISSQNRQFCGQERKRERREKRRKRKNQRIKNNKDKREVDI